MDMGLNLLKRYICMCAIGLTEVMSVNNNFQCVITLSLSLKKWGACSHHHDNFELSPWGINTPTFNFKLWLNSNNIVELWKYITEWPNSKSHNSKKLHFSLCYFVLTRFIQILTGWKNKEQKSRNLPRHIFAYKLCNTLTILFSWTENEARVVRYYFQSQTQQMIWVIFLHCTIIL